MQDQDILQKIAQVLATSNFKKSNQLINYQTINELEKTLNLNKQGSQCWEEVFAWVGQYLEYSPNTSHPNFANRMWVGR